MKAKITSKPRSIFKSQCDEIRAIFDSSKSPSKVMCVALDFAKETHLALICYGDGDHAKKAFPVKNTKAGVAFLIDEITASARRRKIPQKHIFIGGEDIPNYVRNFLGELKNRKYMVVSVNAFEAKNNRENLIASTDELDLLAIAKTMIQRRAQVVRISGSENEKHLIQLRDLTRERRSLVRQCTATSNRIHSAADVLFPGFLNSSKSGISPFLTMSCELMKDRFSAPQIARRKHSSLADAMRRNRVQNPVESAAKLIALAKDALPPDPGQVNSLQISVQCSVALHECLKKNAEQLKLESTILLAQTPYVMLTSIRGIGLVLAAGTAAEIGDPEKMRRLDSLCAYAGIVARVSQSGGPEKAAVTGSTSSRCNRVLKDWVVQAAQKMKMYGAPEIKQRFTRWEVNRQHGAFAGARRYLRLMRSLVKNQTPYLDPQARKLGASREVKAAACEETFEVIVNKWRHIPDWKTLLFAEDRPLGVWRKTVIDLYGAYLPLPGEN